MTYLRSSVRMFQKAPSKAAYGHLIRNAGIFYLALVKTGCVEPVRIGRSAEFNSTVPWFHGFIRSFMTVWGHS